jgi:hypothetical protein
MGRRVQELVERVEASVRGAPLAAGLFRPNFGKLEEVGLLGLVGLPVNRRRERRAIETGVGLAIHSLLVVTHQEVLVFDAFMLQWQAVRLLLQHDRDDLVARPVPLVPVPALLRPFPQTPERAALRLENTDGPCLAEMAPEAWDEEEKGVFKALTGHAGWPLDGSDGRKRE